MSTHSTSSLDLVRLFQKALVTKGLDVLIPTTVEQYNSYLDASAASAPNPKYREFKLKTSSSSLNSHLVLLVGNSKALWKPFMDSITQEWSSNGGMIESNPIDRYVQSSVDSAIRSFPDKVSRPSSTYWVADTEPSKMILAQKMALASKAVSHCPASQLCLHPTLGPWLAFRCALIFDVEGLSPQEEEEFGLKRQPDLCDHTGDLHSVLSEQMEAAFEQSRKQQSGISQDAWKAWVLPRITLAPSHNQMYSSEQILYHYTKDLKYLMDVSNAYGNCECTDYLRDSVPENVVRCRQLLQQVLTESKQQLSNSDNNAILLSGGLDTSIIAEASSQVIHADTIGERISLDKDGSAVPILKFDHALSLQANPTANDASFASAIYQRLEGVSIGEHHILQISLEDLVMKARKVSCILQSFDPMELRNSLVIYATLEKAAALGVQTVVTGDGADEIFCGYSFYHRMDEEALQAYRAQIANVMQFTSSKLAASFGMNVLSPFLDPKVIHFALKLKKEDVVGEQCPVPRSGKIDYGKLVLRKAFPESYSQWRTKEPIEQGAGTTALRMGYFDLYWTDEELEAKRRHVMQEHRVVIRDREHLFFFEKLIEEIQSLDNLGKKRAHGSDGYCPACGFELSHASQDFCVTCGHWPTKVTRTNNKQGFADKALRELSETIERLT